MSRALESTPEDQARDLEKKVHELLEESASEAQNGDPLAGDRISGLPPQLTTSFNSQHAS